MNNRLVLHRIMQMVHGSALSLPFIEQTHLEGVRHSQAPKVVAHCLQVGFIIGCQNSKLVEGVTTCTDNGSSQNKYLMIVT